MNKVENKEFYVRNSNGEKTAWKPDKIRQTILNETDLTNELATKIKTRIQRKINRLREEEGLTEISTTDLRSEVSSQLLKEGEFKAVEQNRKLGMSITEFENLMNEGCKDNANMDYNPEMIAKYAYDSIAKEYALSTMPKDCAEAHIDGFVHHHDMEHFALRPNCMNFDLRFFAKNGLMIDGHGVMGSVAKPAKSLEVLLNHLLQAFMAGATVFSGGMGYTNFNTLLSSFAKGRSYKEIKQAIQGFVYNCNMSLVCRGGQILFSNLGIDLSCPDVLKDEPAVCPGGVINGTYKDYQEEADLILRALLEVSEEKDGLGAYHRFPNLMFNIRKGDLDKYEGNCKLLHEKGANNPTLYYVNCQDMERTVMGCRTALPVNYTGDYNKDSMNTGNFMYSTLNLPLIALKSKDNIQENGKDLMDEFYELLDYYCEIIYKTLIYRRECVIDAVYNKHMSDFLLQKDVETGEPLWDIDRTTITLGFCGLYECLQELEAEQEIGVEIVEYINKKKTEFFNRDGLRWSVIASPAESACHRFALINKEKYPDAKVQGIKDSVYLTNSTHIPVSDETNIIDHIKNAQTYHPLTLGGNLLHLWNGEIWSDPKAIWSLNKKILETGTIYWAYSKVFTHCPECGYTINDELEVCPICGSTNLYVYDRITGYYVNTAFYNKGKYREFKERYRHSFNEGIDGEELE